MKHRFPWYAARRPGGKTALLLLPFFASALGGATALEVPCSVPVLMTRSPGTASCWVSRPVGLGTRGRARLCIPHAKWTDWLQGTEPWPGCGQLLGRLRAQGPDGLAFEVKEVVPRAVETWAVPLRKLEALRERVSVLLRPWDAWGFRRKLILGEPGEGILELLPILGFVHLLSLAGVHLYAVALLCQRAGWAVVALLGTHSRLTPGTLEALRTLAQAASAAGAFLLWVLGGARAGMLRPLLLLGSGVVAKRLGVQRSRIVSLLGALILDRVLGTLWNALHTGALGGASAWAPGFWTYALAVGGGALFSRCEIGGRKLGSHLGLCLGSWLGVAVFEAAQGHPVALLTPALNALCLPWLGGVELPALLAASMGWETPLRLIAPWGQWLLEATVGLGLSGPFVWVPSDIVGLRSWAWVLGPLSVLALLAWPARSLTRAFVGVLAAAWVLAAGGTWISAHSFSPARARGAQVEQLDVGQGDAAWVLAPDGSASLIDTGPEARTSRARGILARRWLLALSRRGTRRLREIGLTHFDADHAGGVPALARLLEVGRVVATHAQWEAPRGEGLRAELTRLGVGTVRVDGTPFESSGSWYWGAWAAESSRRGPKQRLAPNAGMLAAWVPFDGGGGYLNLGDADSAQELRLLRAFPAATGAVDSRHPSVFKFSHHGSRTSGAAEVLHQVVARLGAQTQVWVSSGRGNRYGHPTAEALLRLGKLGLAVRRTDLSGDLRSEAPGP